jgi:hypothetical protein
MALFLKIIGGVLAAGALAFTALVWLVHVGAYDPYPTPPGDLLNGPLGRSNDSIRFRDLYRRQGEVLDAYHERLTRSVSAYMVHWWQPEDRSVVGVHPLDNYPMWLKSFFPGYEHFANYEFVSPGMAWRRGYGFCSQVSRIVYSVLRDQGLDATVMYHPNHVVVEADGHVLDADFGTFIPHSLKYMQQHTELLDGFYGPNVALAVPPMKVIYADGWTETSNKEAFDYMRGFEASARNWRWAPMLMILWMAIAIFDAGVCWEKFAAGLPSLPKFPKMPSWPRSPGVFRDRFRQQSPSG